jgi:hypothetical protein
LLKVYISGPIRGYPDGNKAAFRRAAEKLRGQGHQPVNPHDIAPLQHEGRACLGAEVPHSEHRYGCFMVTDIQALLDCDGYTLLDGWGQSVGALLEEHVARVCGKTYVML